jgi:hypothetical protein
VPDLQIEYDDRARTTSIKQAVVEVKKPEPSAVAGDDDFDIDDI